MLNFRVGKSSLKKINKSRATSLALLLFALLFSSTSYALIEDRRCKDWGDSLNYRGQVKARFEWAMKCETDEDKKADIEIAFKEGIADRSGWVTPGYPSYGKSEFIGKQFKYVNPMKWYAPPTSTDDGTCNRPEGYRIIFYCAAGCYSPEQKILAPSGEVPIAEAFENKMDMVQTLSPNSTMNAIQLKTNTVSKYTTDALPGQQEILEFQMASGGRIRVTYNHPLVNEEGKIVTASELREGQALMRLTDTGEKSSVEPDTIVRIVQKSYYGNVYNLSMKSSDLKENIVVAQGYLNGSSKYQNEWVNQLNRKLLRRVVAADILAD